MLTVQALRNLRANGTSRVAGESFVLPERIARSLAREGAVRLLPAERSDAWWTAAGRELRTPRLISREPARLVACVNAWNDAPALAVTMPRWLPYVDAVVLVDGAYATTGAAECGSTDGTVELATRLCEAHGKPLRVITSPTLWADQVTKRNAYLEAGQAGDVLLVIDCDEVLEDAPELRRLPPGMDCGWLTVSNPTLYTQPYGQPRLFRWRPDLRYDKRHHWVYAGETLLAAHQYGGAGFLHRLVPVRLTNMRGLHHTPARAEAKRRHLVAQHGREMGQVADLRSIRSDRAVGKRESLRIVQTGRMDAGGVAFRLHTALNTTTPHASSLVTPRGPLKYPVQYVYPRDLADTDRVLRDADILHCHLDYSVPMHRKVPFQGRPVVIHHHGTMFRRDPGPEFFAMLDARWAGLRLVSNLELLSYGDNLEWLPNPVPVAYYRKVRAEVMDGVGFGKRMRVGHSPTKRHLKGTEAFLAACDKLAHLVEPVLIEGEAHREAIQKKATCDVFFDSFFLGLQCSGLEAAAMGLPVVAGDETVAMRYRQRFGMVPYTFANDEKMLTDVLHRLATDAVWREAEGSRVALYTEAVHDDAAVALRYLDLLDQAFAWRTAPRPLTHVPPMPRKHLAPETIHPKASPVESPAVPAVEVR